MNELYCKIGITVLLIAIFGLDRTRSPRGNMLVALAAAVVAVLALYLIRASRQRSAGTHRGVAYVLAFAALLAILGGAVFA